jgi:glycosyltransferase involved in cell wall biosynthesis
MPAWNAEQFIAEAMDSVLTQTFKDFEFIIINDGSTDGTSKIIRSYNDPRIIFIDNEKNQGVAVALNQGMGMARGKYIARMDADDISYPERFMKQVEFMEKNPNVGVLGADVQVLDGRDYKALVQKGRVGLLGMMRDNKICHPTVMLRKSTFDQHNLRYSSDFEAAEDYELWARAVRYTAIANLPDVLLKYRWHDNNTSKRKRESQLMNVRKVRESLVDYIAGQDDEDKKLLKFYFGNTRDVGITTYLFGLFRLLEHRSTYLNRKIYLFGIIPLVKIKKNKVYLFHIIPVATIGKMRWIT